MRVVHDAWNEPEISTGSVVTIGNYDGIHRGQRAILETVVARARAEHLDAAVVTFDPHPLAVLRPDAAPPRLTTPSQKARLLAEIGVDLLAIVEFTPAVAHTSAESFVRELLHRRLGLREVRVGSRFVFGREREGDLGLLERLGRELGFTAHGLAEVLHGGEPVSSTRTRRALAAGEVTLARELLGRPYAVAGRVTHGDGRGKELGWPTLNLATESDVLPADGVYVSVVDLPDGGGRRGGVTNVGRRPTFEAGGGRVVECHLFDFEGDLYGRHVELSFLERLREERSFPSADALVEQIGRDAGAAREYLAREFCLEQMTTRPVGGSAPK